jgi:arginyl-tRNA--protein-N-Asp/Glu arginylyltransferase
LYNPDDPKDHDRIGMAAPINYEKVDEGRVYNEGGDGIYPGKGSYHFYHRIDGRLVAVGNIDLSTTILNSQYFIYDPEFQFLCMGVIGAIHEIEYMKMIQKTFNCEIKYYQLGELVLNCPKVNYKLNYKPGLLICPRTK